MIDDEEIHRIRARNVQAPGALERLSDFLSRQWRGLSRIFAGLPIGIVLAAGVVLAVVEAYMISQGFRSLMGVGVAAFSGAVLVGAFIWLVHEFFTSLETNEPWWEKVGWGLIVGAVFALVSFSFFVTQVNNATFNYEEAAQRQFERESLTNRIAGGEIQLRTMTVPTWYEADKLALEAVQASAARWRLNSFSDCAPEGGFARQAQVDICNMWGELRVRIAESEATLAERQRIIDELDALRAELADKPLLQGDASWDAVQKIRGGDVATSRAIILALISAFMIWVTAFIWHKLIKRFKRKGARS